MFSISYRTKQRLKSGLKAALVCLAVVVAFIIVGLIFLQRYVVYTPNGTYLDFHHTMPQTAQETTQPATAVPEINIQYASADNSYGPDAIAGYYIDLSMLQDPSAVQKAVEELSPCTIVLDLKSASGKFYYSTDIDGAQTASVDITQVDDLISYLKSQGFTLTARIDAFRDNAFVKATPEAALTASDGGRWSDGEYNYLDPQAEETMAYWVQIVKELSEKGFKEVIFADFSLPDSKQIAYPEGLTRQELTQTAAQELIRFFSSSNVTISFGDPDAGFTLDNHNSRVYFTGIDGTTVSATVSAYSALDTDQMVFLTNSRDTRFSGYRLLRPLLSS